MSKNKLTKDKQAIFEIFRACRLCGAGGGYKMPIIQNFGADAESEEIELQQKIRECVQIEVHLDDKMPPLICELCVDKINDYYEFTQMCKQTNARTRCRLGLPPQTLPQGSADDCILGVTEPVFVNEDSDDEALSRSSRKKSGKNSVKHATPTSKTPVVRLTRNSSPIRNRKDDKRQARNSSGKFTASTAASKSSTRGSESTPSSTRNSRKRSVSPLSSRSKRHSGPTSPISRSSRKRSLSPVLSRSTRGNRSYDADSDDAVPLKKAKTKESVPSKSTKSTPPKEAKMKSKDEEKSALKNSREKDRKREKENVEETKPKKVNFAIPPPQPRVFCEVCKQSFSKASNAKAHQIAAHQVTYTQERLACNACREWFTTSLDVQNHHRMHKTRRLPYACTLCMRSYDTVGEFEDHIENNECVDSNEVPDIKCDECWSEFPTRRLYDAHVCLGDSARPGGKCAKCNKKVVKYKNLIKHELTCTKLPKNVRGLTDLIRKRLHLARVCVKRIDDIYTFNREGKIHVSELEENLDFALNRVYPFKVYINYDSDTSIDEEGEPKKRVEKLSYLTLKALFSAGMLGEKEVMVYRRRRPFRKVKKVQETLDTSINTKSEDSEKIEFEKNAMEDDEFDMDDNVVNEDVTKIIDSLGDDDEVKDESKSEQVDKVASEPTVEAPVDEINDETKVDGAVKESEDVKESETSENSSKTCENAAPDDEMKDETKVGGAVKESEDVKETNSSKTCENAPNGDDEMKDESNSEQVDEGASEPILEVPANKMNDDAKVDYVESFESEDVTSQNGSKTCENLPHGDEEMKDESKSEHADEVDEAIVHKRNNETKADDSEQIDNDVKLSENEVVKSSETSENDVGDSKTCESLPNGIADDPGGVKEAALENDVEKTDVVMDSVENNTKVKDDESLSKNSEREDEPMKESLNCRSETNECVDNKDDETQMKDESPIEPVQNNINSNCMNSISMKDDSGNEGAGNTNGDLVNDDGEMNDKISLDDLMDEKDKVEIRPCMTLDDISDSEMASD